MFDWDVQKREVPELVQFCIGDLPMYTFFFLLFVIFIHI